MMLAANHALADDGLPLAASVRDDSRDLLMSLGKRFDVLLDGQVMTRVIGYDVDRGLLHRFQTDADGKHQFAPGKTRLLEEHLTGKVEARWKAGAQ